MVPELVSGKGGWRKVDLEQKSLFMQQEMKTQRRTDWQNHAAFH